MALKLKRHKLRRYRETGGKREMLSPAEYAIFRGDERLALITRAAAGWRVCVPTAASSFGRAVSPVGLDKFRAVRDWAIEFFGN